MSERIAKKVSQFRERVNSYFFLGFKKKLINNNERGIANLEEDCLTIENFIVQIGILSTFVDDFNELILRSCLKGKYQQTGSVNLLEKLLEENKLKKGNITRNLRYIKRIRNTLFPFHRGTSGEFVELMRELSFRFPLDWSNLWKTCLSMYLNSLAELQNQLDELNMRRNYQKGIENQKIEKSRKNGSVIYLNDVLFKYRILIPTDYKFKNKLLIDYITASIIAYERNLKSINYALRKYVIPLKDRFREHTEDVYFVKRRRFVNNRLLQQHRILLSRDEIGIKDEKEFQRYFWYIYASVVAYYMDITPDWLVTHYWGKHLAQS